MAVRLYETIQEIQEDNHNADIEADIKDLDNDVRRMEEEYEDAMKNISSEFENWYKALRPHITRGNRPT